MSVGGVTLGYAVLLAQVLLHVVGGLEEFAALRTGGGFLNRVLHPARTTVSHFTPMYLRYVTVQHGTVPCEYWYRT